MLAVNLWEEASGLDPEAVHALLLSPYQKYNWKIQCIAVIGHTIALFTGWFLLFTTPSTPLNRDIKLATAVTAICLLWLIAYGNWRRYTTTDNVEANPEDSPYTDDETTADEDNTQNTDDHYF